jgi:hypothetical protein
MAAGRGLAGVGPAQAGGLLVDAVAARVGGDEHAPGLQVDEGRRRPR